MIGMKRIIFDFISDNENGNNNNKAAIKYTSIHIRKTRTDLFTFHTEF